MIAKDCQFYVAVHIQLCSSITNANFDLFGLKILTPAAFTSIFHFTVTIVFKLGAHMSQRDRQMERPVRMLFYTVTSWQGGGQEFLVVGKLSENLYKSCWKIFV